MAGERIISVILRAKSGEYKKEMDDAAKKTRDLGSDADKASKQTQTAFQRMDQAGRKLQGVGTALTAGVTLPLAALAKASIDAASDLEESVSKVGVLFGDNADEIEQWADSAATSMGMSKRSALDAAGSFGAMFDAMGLIPEQSVEMSMTLTELAGDLASFHNADPTDMLTNLRSALAGEVEPLRKFGVNISAAAVEAKALQMGLADANGEITESEKVQARYQLILEQTSSAQGDFLRTADGLANSQRTLTAQWEDARAELGQQLLPIALDFVDVLQSMVGWFANLSPEMQKVVVFTGALAAAAGPAALTVGSLMRGVSAMAEVAPKAMTGLRNMSGFLMGPWGIALGAAALAVGAFMKAKADDQKRLEEWRATLDDVTGAITDQTRALAVERLTMDDAFTHARNLGISTRDLTDAVLGNEAAYHRVQSALDEHMRTNTELANLGNLNVEAVQELNQALGENRAELGQVTEEERVQLELLAESKGEYLDVAHAIRDGLDPATASMIVQAQEAAKATEEGTDALSDHTDAVDEDTDAVDDNVRAMREQHEQMLKSVSPVFALTSALDDVEKAQADYNAAVDEYGTESVEAQRAAEDLVGAIAEAEAAAIDGDMSFGEFETQLKRWVDAGRITEEQAGLIRDRVAEARAAAEDYEGNYMAHVEAQTAQAEQALDRVRWLTTQIPRHIAIGVQAGGGLLAGTRAHGGPVDMGGAYLVGEHGPEIVRFPSAGYVHNATETKQIMDGQGDVQVRVFIGDRELTGIVKTEVSNSFRGVRQAARTR